MGFGQYDIPGEYAGLILYSLWFSYYNNVCFIMQGRRTGIGGGRGVKGVGQLFLHFQYEILGRDQCIKNLFEKSHLK